MTGPTMAVLRVLLEEPTVDRYGLQLGAAAGLPSGTVHPILARLERAGWVSSHWEAADPRQEGRPRRRYYQLTQTGIYRAEAALRRAEAAKARLQRRLRLELSGGGA